MGTPLSKTALSRLKVAELKEALKEEGWSTAGLKADLVERLYILLTEQSRCQSAHKRTLACSQVKLDYLDIQHAILCHERNMASLHGFEAWRVS